MKITRRQLRKMIQENIGSILKEEVEDEAELNQAQGHADAAIAAATDGKWKHGPETAEGHWDKLTDIVSGSEGYHSDAIESEDITAFKEEINNEMASAHDSLARHQNLNEENNMKETNEGLEKAVMQAMQEVAEESGAQKSSPELSEPKHLSEARKHVRNVINEIMVGMTPITRMETQRDADAAGNGNATDTGVNKAEIGFNTFNMQEWASIAGITESAELKEGWHDDGYGSNVVDLRDPASDESHEIPGMISHEQHKPADCDIDCSPESCVCARMAGPVTGDVGHSSEVGDMEFDFERFLKTLELQDDAGVTRIGAAAEEGDEHHEDEHGEWDRGPRG